ncbi:MAG TPA: hypothetical protein VGS79_27125 [Puia sp.]|nr:hypothetical protein [Puia sp.]
MDNLFDMDIEALLKQKLEYHMQQVRYHDKMAAETRTKLCLLATGVENNGTADPSQADSLPTQLPEPAPENKKYSITYWRPRVEEYLRQMDTYMKTEDIFVAIGSGITHTPGERRKIITAISSSLYYLVECKKVHKIESDGRGNSYKWINGQ